VSRKKAVFAGCARNCAEPLPKVLRNVERLSGLFEEAAFVLVENDSTDQTRHILEEWGRARANFKLVRMDDLQFCALRTVRLAIARNTYLEVIRNSTIREFDYLFVMDMDDVNERELSVESVVKALAFLESQPSHAGVFANQSGAYFDMWALRHSMLCPRDVWEEVLEYAMVHSCSDEEAFARTFKPRIFSLSPGSEPVEVASAFGGFGIYKLHYALGSRYVGRETKIVKNPPEEFRVPMQICEHVPFNMGIEQQGGRLFVLPWLLNWDGWDAGADATWFIPSFYRELLIDELPPGA
jgi:glycosyltransferase involved in cell wall biosynthesis